MCPPSAVVVVLNFFPVISLHTASDATCVLIQVADYGLVGDLFQVIPELIEKLPETEKLSS